MNSSVIVLDSDDEEDQIKKSIVPKPSIHTSVINQNMLNMRNNVTLTPATNQFSKTKPSATLQPLSALTKNGNNSVSIIPINTAIQNTAIQSPKNAQRNSPIARNPQVTRISPKSSPRNSPKLKNNASLMHPIPPVSSQSNIPTGVLPSFSSVLQRNQPTSTTTLSAHMSQAKQMLEDVRNYNNNEIIPPDYFSSKPSQIPMNLGYAGPLSHKRKYLENMEHFPPGAFPPQSIIKRVKPTLVSNTVSSRWAQSSAANSITIDDDDDCLESSSRPKQLPEKLKSRSNSIASSVPSPSPSTSSATASPQSQRPPATPSPSLKDCNRQISTPKNSANSSMLVSPQHNSVDGKITPNLEKNSETITKNEPSDDLLNTSESSIQNGSATEDQEKNIIIPAFEELISACRNADTSDDMELLIETKLLRYYHSIHPDYITSKAFRKTVESITTEILATPNLVYIKLKTIVEELKQRKNSKVIVVSNDGQTTTGNKEIDDQVKKLNKGLRKLKCIIAKLEEDEVDWDDDLNSPFLKVERCKKRACEIYEKICDLTGESKHAQRTVRKPIVFEHTAYHKINKAIECFVNKTKTFPDFPDIHRILEHCNKTYKLDLTSEELKRIAQDAFVKVGKLLQKRRKTDLYETVLHYTEQDKDPALADAELNAKLTENKKHYGKINALIQKYAREQDTLTAERLKTKENSRKNIFSGVSSEITSSEESNDLNINKKNENNIEKSSNNEKTSSSTVIVTEEQRNIPSCSYKTNDSNSNSKINKTTINNKEDSNNTEKTIEKISSERLLQLSNTNNNTKESSNENDEKTTSQNGSSKENLRENHKQGNLRIVTVESLQAPKDTIDVVNNESKLKKTNSISNPSLNVNMKPKETIVAEIILSDDDV